ncbi:gamma-glutamyltranspeptidase 2 [Biomphalaria pfeifferi]|uniref:Gamma-glutamyltranspeptidase 2 n=1 Tax=Biomphalaria pfeifferi TaxID=112525 RepID=A0AAD8ARX3_BIOPF|nr:gamma-glutamyltranspeptidase 2 [Biomphalaria pfeifferi]
MESIEQPFDSITRIVHDMPDVGMNDKTGLIETDRPGKPIHNGDSPGAESSPLHQLKTTNSILYGPQNRGLRVITVSAIVFSIAITIALILTIYLEPKQVHGHAAIACEDVRCSDIGLSILKDGGNAVDAAVATAFCLGVVNPAHSGIGGGGFGLVHDHKYKLSWAYNFREAVPAKLALDELNVANKEKSIKSAGVPGLVKGLHVIHKQHGQMPWKKLLEPSIELASSGFNITKELAELLKAVNPPFNDAELRNLFMRDGVMKGVNDTVIWPSLGETLGQIANDPDSFYTGSLMRKFVDTVKQLQGSITEEDMKNYTVTTPEVLKTKFKELTVISLPPPAGGTLVALILKMAETLGWKANQVNTTLAYHQLIEIYKFVYAHQSLLGDPAFNPQMLNTTRDLLSDEFVAFLVGKINDNTTFNETSHYGPFSPQPSAGTSHLTVIDSSELMVSMTLSINYNFGNQITVGEMGIILNNELLDLNLNNLSLPNGFAGGKRPQSYMSPTILFNDEHPCDHRIIIGGSGGDKIVAGLAESIINAVIFNQNLSSAVCSPRVHNELTPVTWYEDGISENILTELRGKNHFLERLPPAESAGINGIEKTNDAILPYADYRKFGGVAMY